MKFLGLSLLIVSLFVGTTAAAPTVFSGFDVSFSKSSFADPLSAPNYDPIVSNVALSRGNTGGIFNVALESSFATNSSPAGTAWAFKANNPGKTIAATNWADLTFANWQTALGGGGSLATNILDGSGVLHLVDADIYLDIRFTAWGQGSTAGGSFAYERAAIFPVPEPASFFAMSLASIAILMLRRR